MQHLEETVKKDVIKHATRTIELIYEPGKTVMTKQDEQLRAAYIKLHDFELKMQKTADKLFRESVPLNKTIDNLREELMKAQATFADCCKLADKLSDVTYSSGETSLEQLTESQEQTGKEILAYSDKIMKVYEIVVVLSKEVGEYNVASEDESNLLYDKYAAIKTAHSANWETNSINIVTFEDEYEKFHSYRSVREDNRVGLMDYCDKTISNYTSLNLQTTTLYNVWNEFVKRCNLLRAMADLHANALAIGIN
ncbi:MAG TPA: hypothetical protein VIJ92_08180 [Ginsengibacter sp.]